MWLEHPMRERKLGERETEGNRQKKKYEKEMWEISPRETMLQRIYSNVAVTLACNKASFGDCTLIETVNFRQHGLR